MTIYKSIIGALALILLSDSTNAQGSPVDLAKVCKVKSSPDYSAYWAAVTKSQPVPIPQSALITPPSNPGDPRCMLEAAAADKIFATFKEAAEVCGFIAAVNIGLVRGTAGFCDPSDEKQPFCKPIETLRSHLDGKLDQSSVLASPTSDVQQPGTYRLYLGSSYAQKDREERIALFLGEVASWTNGGGSQPDGARLVCASAIPEPFRIPIPNTKIVSIAKDPPAVTRPLRGAKRDLSKVSAAELSLAFDRENRTVTERDDDGEPLRSQYDDFVTFNGAIGYNLNRNAVINRKPEDARTFWNDSILVVYSSLEYAEAFDPTEETDNLAIGARGIAQLGWNQSGVISNPTLDFAWVTDIEERESAQWRASAEAGFFWLDTPTRWSSWFPIQWTTDGVVDYLHVIDEGDKASLSDVGEAIRLGYNIDWSLNWTPFEIGHYRPTLSGAYKYRDATDEGGADADLVTIDLGIIPLKKNEAGLGLSLGYERGENLTSLEPVEAYKIKLELKN